MGKKWNLYDLLTTALGEVTFMIRDDGQADPADEIKLITFDTLKGWLKTYFDTLYTIANRIIANTTALTTTEGFLRWDSTRKLLVLYDTQRERGITPIGWLPFALSIGATIQAAYASNVTLAAAGGCAAIPFLLQAPMMLRSVSVRNGNVASNRTWNWGLYEQYLNNGNSGENTLTRVAVGAAAETFTAGAASNRTIDASGAPVFLAPGLYWLVVQSQHASNSFDLAIQTGGAGFIGNTFQTKTITNPMGSALDFVAAAWTKQVDVPSARLNGDVFGQTAVF